MCIRDSSKTVINNNTTRKERVRELAGFGHGADRLKQSQTVRTLREAAAEANGLPFERTILRYRYAHEGKELINDAATLERKKLASIDDVHISEEPQTPYYVYREVRANWTFFDSVFRTYASLDVLESETTAGDDVFAERTSVTTQVRMSEDQFVRAFARCDLHVKLSNAQYGGSEQALRTVFRAVKDAIAEAEQMTLSDLDGVGELFGALAPSELSRLARRVKHPDGLALDEFVTAVVLLAWMTYGFRVPRSWDRGVARALRFFVERVMRPNVPEAQLAERDEEARAREQAGVTLRIVRRDRRHAALAAPLLHPGGLALRRRHVRAEDERRVALRVVVLREPLHAVDPLLERHPVRRVEAEVTKRHERLLRRRRRRALRLTRGGEL